jgi:hypothetical protein
MSIPAKERPNSNNSNRFTISSRLLQGRISGETSGMAALGPALHVDIRLYEIFRAERHLKAHRK